MKKNITTLFFIVLTISFVWGQNQNYTTGTNTYTFNNVGTAQLTGIPNGTTVQVECYGAGGGGGGVWTAHYASTSSGGAGGGGYAKLNFFTVVGGSLDVTVGAGGIKGSGSSSLQVAYDGLNGGYSAVYSSNINDTICKANGGYGSLHASAQNGSAFSPAKMLGVAGIGGQGTIGDVLLTGATGTVGTTPTFNTGVGGDGGNGAGPLGGPGGLFANTQIANYGVDGSPYGGGGSGCADYEGGGGATFKIGGNGADGGVIITILNIGITTQALTSTSFCAGDSLTVAYTANGTFNAGNIFSLQLSDATGDFTTPTVIGSISSTSSGSIDGLIPTITPFGTGYLVRVVADNPIITGTDNGTAITIQVKPNAPTASTLDFCGSDTVANLSPNGIDIAWYSSSSSTTPLSNSQVLSTQTYFVTQTTNGCESDKTSVQVNVHSLPSVDAGADISICLGDSTLITANGALTYTWNHGLGNANPQTVSPQVDTYYSVEGVDQYNCVNTDSVLVSMKPLPVAIAGDTLPSICIKETSIIMFGSISGSATSGTWSGGSGTWNNASDPQSATYTAGANDSGWIQLELITSGGSCPNDTAFNYIQINDCTLGIQTETQHKVQLYPNPATSIFNIEGDDLTTNYSHYQLITLAGKMVKNGEINSNHHEINVLDLNKGLYLLQLTGKKSVVLKLEVK